MTHAYETRKYKIQLIQKNNYTNAVQTDGTVSYTLTQVNITILLDKGYDYLGKQYIRYKVTASKHGTRGEHA